MALNEKQAQDMAKYWAHKHGVDDQYQPARWIVEMLMVVASPVDLPAPGAQKHAFFVAQLDGNHGVGICEQLMGVRKEEDLTPEWLDRNMHTPVEEGLLVLMMEVPYGTSTTPVAMWTNRDGGKWQVAHILRARIAACERDIAANTDYQHSMAGAHMAAGLMQQMLTQIETALATPETGQVKAGR